MLTFVIDASIIPSEAFRVVRTVPFVYYAHLVVLALLPLRAFRAGTTFQCACACLYERPTIACTFFGAITLSSAGVADTSVFRATLIPFTLTVVTAIDARSFLAKAKEISFRTKWHIGTNFLFPTADIVVTIAVGACWVRKVIDI